MYGMDSVQICGGSRPWRLATGARERPTVQGEASSGWGGVVRGEAGSGWLGENRGSRKRAEKESKKRAKRESIGVKCFGKWFTENFFVNRFPNFCEGFSDQLQTISVDFYFTAKQTPANDENVLRKIFYVETNGALEHEMLNNFSFMDYCSV
jgi:hypothetical protein